MKIVDFHERNTADPEHTFLKGRADGRNRRFSVDVSGISGRGMQQHLLTCIRNSGYHCRNVHGFWMSFPEDPGSIPERAIVFGELSAIVKCYMRHRHCWMASVREKRPYFIGLIVNSVDEQFISMIDELVRGSDMRATVCRDLESDLPRCLLKAASAILPCSLVDVRYSVLSGQLWVQFSDGFFGFVVWNRLGMQNEVEKLMLQTAAISDNGATVEILTHNGDAVRIDAASVSGALSAICQPVTSQAGVGTALRSARLRAGISQQELGSRAGINQAHISRLEKGHYCPRGATLERVAAVLGCAATDLLLNT